MNDGNSKKSQRIAANTLILFVRMFVVMLVNFYTVRIVLDRLGIEDYGIFNAIAGVVTFTSFISGVMELSIQRFYSIAIGEKDGKKQNEIFNLSMAIIIAASAMTFLIMETAGLWMLNTQLTIPEARFEAAEWCFHTSLVTFFLTLLQIPFSAAVFAHEKMNVYAVISTSDCLLKLFAALSIGLLAIDNLIFYSIILMIIGFIVFGLYAVYGIVKFPECRIRKTHNNQLLKDLLSFSGWTLLGSIAKVGTFQGNTIMLNIFFGPVVNAAFAISMQISNAFNALCSSMVFALRPAMIQVYAEKNFTYLNKLFNISNKFILYVLLVIAFPMIYETEYILDIWLPDVTQDMVVFARLIIIYIVCLSLNSPITTIMQASGKVKQYFVPVEAVSLLCLPITFVFLKLGLPAQWTFISMISTCVMAHVVRLWCLRRYYKPFSLSLYMKSFVFPAALISLAGICLTVLSMQNTSGIMYHIAGCVILPLSIIILVLFVGMSTKERMLMYDLIKNKYRING